ncbi:alpha/beta fold hydrolase [Sneathiella sp.]|jgi:maspardin|uniref:alpha/beta fold hydrolase n=1 Tax=Sneathiella sp. TaxID=1964365 RepID=UPI0039E66921
MTNALIKARDAFSSRHPEKRMMLNGRDWGVLDVGSGPALILIPGTLGRADIFWQQIEALSDRLRLVALSYPNSGGIEDWSEDLMLLLEQLEIGRASILGSSLGGYLAQYFASAHPKKVSVLIAANTLHSVVGMDQRAPYSSDLEAAPIEELRQGFAAGLRLWEETHPEQSDLVELLLNEVNGRILEKELRARLSALKFGPELSEYQANSVTVETEDDPLIPDDMRQSVRARLKPEVAYRFLWGGHFPYVIRPEFYTSLLEETLNLGLTGPQWGKGGLREK